MHKIYWNNLFCNNDAQSAFRTFHKMLSDLLTNVSLQKMTTHITIWNLGWRLLWKNLSKL